MRERRGRILILFNEQNGKCAYCGDDMTLELGTSKTATKDHIVPKKLVGASLREFNLVAACSDCNTRKGSMKLSEFIGILTLEREHG